MTNFSGENLNAACGGPQGGGMDSRRNGVAEVSPAYLSDVTSTTIPVGYKQTEVGVIPEDWEVVTLGDIGQTVIGLTYSPNDVADFGTLVLRSSNVQNGKLAYADNVYVNMELPERVIVKQGDILICVRNGSRQLIGKCALIDENAEGSAFGAFMSIFRTKYSVFVFYQFQSDLIQNQINEIMGATINQITNKDMSGFKITLPSDEKEQTAIANALSDVDALISELEKLIAKKQAIKTATMQQLLTGRTRLPQFALREDGTPKGTKQSELGEIPEDWEVVELGSIASIKTGSKNNQDKVLDGVYPFFVRSETVERLNSFSYDCEAILVPGEGGIGSIFHYINGKFDAHQRVYVIRNFSNCIGKYIYFQMRNNFGSHAMENSVKATVDSLRLPTFLEFKVLIPAKDEQTAIATILSDMNAEIQALEQRLGKTRQIKQGMMQELLTGKTRLMQPQNKECQHG